ncbi:hypothetical protein DFH28DRAFT_1031846, partial [Melampsora americana]
MSLGLYTLISRWLGFNHEKKCKALCLLNLILLFFDYTTPDILSFLRTKRIVKEGNNCVPISTSSLDLVDKKSTVLLFM